jgi:hypothetical protein
MIECNSVILSDIQQIINNVCDSIILDDFDTYHNLMDLYYADIYCKLDGLETITKTIFNSTTCLHDIKNYTDQIDSDFLYHYTIVNDNFEAFKFIAHNYTITGHAHMEHLIQEKKDDYSMYFIHTLKEKNNFIWNQTDIIYYIKLANECNCSDRLIVELTKFL